MPRNCIRCHHNFGPPNSASLLTRARIQNPCAARTTNPADSSGAKNSALILASKFDRDLGLSNRCPTLWKLNRTQAGLTSSKLLCRPRMNARFLADECVCWDGCRPDFRTIARTDSHILRASPAPVRFVGRSTYRVGRRPDATAKPGQSLKLRFADL